MFKQNLYAPLRAIASLWVRPDVLPEQPSDMVPNTDSQICYVLETGGLADHLALQIVCAANELPAPYRGSALALWSRNKDAPNLAATATIRRARGFLFRRSHPQLKRLESVMTAGQAERLVFVPVAIYWGRSPDKEHSLVKLLFSEDWDVAGRTRKFFRTLFHGRQTLVRFSEPIQLADLIDDNDKPELHARKLSRVLRVHFRQRRIASLGPDQSHRNTIIAQVLRNESVIRAVGREEKKQGSADKSGPLKLPRKKRSAAEQANYYAHEIAADMNFVTVRLMQRLLQALWNRFYDGVQFGGLDRLKAVGDGKEIVYVPCHRSHIDYLLLSYALFMKGFGLPHIAAGLNLNVPLVGPILRHGGAFYLRRSFSGNRLYATVFSAYVQEIIARGHSMEYFIEGGRSRSGRLLQPKLGMLQMTLQAYLQDTQRPIVFVPVYFGYERLLEGQSFISELGGAAKQKETFFGFLSSLKGLFQQFGDVYANIGEPIELDAMLYEHNADWRQLANENDIGERPKWINPVVDQLGIEIMQRINRAAAVTPISLLGIVLLAAPRQNLAKIDLIAQLELLLTLLARLPYSQEATVTERSAEEIIQHGADLGYVNIEASDLGDIVSVVPRQAIAMTYFRNNVLHLFALPATIAACFAQRESMARDEVLGLSQLAYQFLKKELFLQWPTRETEPLVDDIIKLFEQFGMLTASGNAISRSRSDDSAVVQMMLLSQCAMPALQRYYMASVILARQGSGKLSQSELEQTCEACAERLGIMYGIRSPDFFDRKLFRSFVQTLRDMDQVHEDSNGLLHFEASFEASLQSLDEQASILLDEQIRHSIKSIAAAIQQGQASQQQQPAVEK